MFKNPNVSKLKIFTGSGREAANVSFATCKNVKLYSRTMLAALKQAVGIALHIRLAEGAKLDPVVQRPDEVSSKTYSRLHKAIPYTEGYSLHRHTATDRYVM